MNKTRLCGRCGETDGVLYESLPPKVKCNRDDLFHELDDECSYKKDDEMSEKKPRICEILGVEVGECFTVKGYDGEISIRPDGTFAILSGNGVGASYAVLNAINDPELFVRRKPRLTESELAICKSMGAKWVTMDDRNTAVFALLWDGDMPLIYNSSYSPYANGETASTLYLGSIICDLFPSLKPGDCIKVEDI